MLLSYHGSDEALIFRRFTGEAVADKANLGDHSLPRLLLSLSSFDYFEHFCLSLGTHFGQGHLPFALKKTLHICVYKPMTLFSHIYIKLPLY